MVDLWICDRCKDWGVVCKIVKVPGARQSTKPSVCPYGFECDWKEPNYANGVDSYVKWRTKDKLNMCLVSSVYEDYVQFCTTKDFQPCNRNTLMRALKSRHGIKGYNVRKGNKIYRVIKCE
jgi:hypothetical protein